MTLIFQSMFPMIISNGSCLWPPETFSLRWLDRQWSYKGRGGPVEPATVAKAKGSRSVPMVGATQVWCTDKDDLSGRLWSLDNALKTSLAPQAAD